MITLNIDGKEIKTESGKTILEAALDADIYIPNLCYHPDIPPTAACRVCVVEIEGARGYPASCTTEVKDGMVIKTNTDALNELRSNNIWLMLSEYNGIPDKESQLKTVADWVGIKNVLKNYVKDGKKRFPINTDEPLFVRDPNLCILCERCIKICQEIRGVGAIGLINRGVDTYVGTSNSVLLMDSGCKFCTACVEVCPSGALMDRKKYEEKKKAEANQTELEEKESLSVIEREKDIVPCIYGCPAGVNIPLYVKLTAEGKFQDALEVIRTKFPFPYVLGLVCFHPCETACKRTEINEPISIKAIKHYVAEQDSGRWKEKLKIQNNTGKKVAIVGSGPAGLTAAWFLRLKGHNVTVFEKLEKTGGMMRTAIPAYRLPRKILDGEIEEIKNIGVEIKCNMEIKNPDKLLEEGYDAVFLAIGTYDTMKMGIDGENSPSVLDGLDVLFDINMGRKVSLGKEIAIVGGGNVAMDVARCALRVGVKKVNIIYRRSREQMPATDEEIEETMLEGVNFMFLTNPKKILPDKDKAKIECIKMKLGEPDASGRRRPIPIEGSEFILEVDNMILAIGQKSKVPAEFELELDKWNNILADKETMETNKKSIFAGGDVVLGPSSVIEAVQTGRLASKSIDKFLGGDGEIEQQFIDIVEYDPYLGREEDFAYRKRAEVKTIPVKERLNNFKQVECNYTEEVVKDEAKRCLKCDLRLKISKAPFPPIKKS